MMSLSETTSTWEALSVNSNLAQGAHQTPTTPPTEASPKKRISGVPNVIALTGRPIQESDLKPLCGSFLPLRVCLRRCPDVCDLRVLGETLSIKEVCLDGCVALQNLSALRVQTALRSLHIINSDISEDDLRDIGSMRALKALDLSSCKVLRGVNHLMALPALRAIHLCGTAITDADVEDLGDSQSLVTIDLRHCLQLKDVSPLMFVKSLEVLLLKGCSGLAHIGSLGKLPKLRVLDLSGSAVTNDSVNSLRKSQSLVILYLNRCPKLIDVSSFVFIVTLEVLLLRGCAKLERAGSLGKLPKLRVLDLSRTCITDGEVSTLTLSRSLVRLYLDYCANLSNISCCFNISSLEIFSAKSSVGVKCVASFCKTSRIRVLKLSGASFLTRPASDQRQSLMYPYVADKRYVDCTVGSAILCSATLEVLILKDVKIPFDITSLEKLSKLRVLDLSYTSFCDKRAAIGSSKPLVHNIFHPPPQPKSGTVSSLLRIETLEVLLLKKCKDLTQMGLLGCLPKLRVLDLSGTSLSDADVEDLGDSTTLTTIHLVDCKNVTDASPLSSIASLEVLHLKGCKCLAHIGSLGKLSKLRVLDLSGTDINDYRISGLRKSTSLVFIYMNNCSSVVEVSPLASIVTLKKLFLKKCDNLRTLGDLMTLPRLKIYGMDRDAFGKAA